MGMTAGDMLITTYFLAGQQIHHEDGSRPCISMSTMVHPVHFRFIYPHTVGGLFLQDSDEIWSINIRKMNYTQWLQLEPGQQLIPVTSLLHYPFQVPFSPSSTLATGLDGLQTQILILELSHFLIIMLYSARGCFPILLSSELGKGIPGDTQVAHQGSTGGLFLPIWEHGPNPKCCPSPSAWYVLSKYLCNQ